MPRTSVAYVKLTSRSLTLYESLFYSTNADDKTQRAHDTHTHTPHMCTPAGVQGLQGAQYLAVVAMGNRGRGGGGGWGSGTVGATLYSPSRCSHIIKHTWKRLV